LYCIKIQFTTFVVYYVIACNHIKTLKGMINLSEIRQLSTEEKLHLMETIWQELSLDENEIEMSQAHKDMLDKREEMVKEGKAEFLEWDDVKVELQKTGR